MQSDELHILIFALALYA